MNEAGVVIVGAGQGGFQLAASLREGGFTGPVTLLGEETALPYQRPPLSKAFIKTDDDPATLIFRPAAFYEKHGITVRLGVRAVSVERGTKRVHVGDGSTIGYDQLVLATGARNRTLTVPGIDRAGVFALRDATDGLALRAALHAVRGGRVIVVGGGFQGLEMAASGARDGLIGLRDRSRRPIDGPDRQPGDRRLHARPSWRERDHRQAG